MMDNKDKIIIAMGVILLIAVASAGYLWITSYVKDSNQIAFVNGMKYQNNLNINELGSTQKLTMYYQDNANQTQSILLIPQGLCNSTQ
jgi:hypothetical protein